MGDRRSWSPARVAAPSLLLAASLLVGCSDGDDDGEAGYVVRQSSVGEIPGARLEFAGTVTALDDGCLMLDRGDGTMPWIVWPPGAAPGGGGGVVVDAETYLPGDPIRGTGTLAVLADLPGGAHDDTYFGRQGKRCDADSAGVAVLDSIAPAG
ncbi:hypothetical protein QQX10_03185 [Demequina sp. SYSU T00039]|uniref:Lipoprotein n=1 Tax=Demequina lignilytica TaxID=3051663 RepID=A0AAW7M1B2_9MICO|nr:MULTISPECIES: hypothetical protein [unclassified Demequina]MDN4478329.1 hypothetical protein [Demequina sp. SYSU T00039-1]MDN4487164.1 hypothetical protein [Demequina sp. SYSU T00039]MDN4489875.1 hypothetical protein [Demequina sp. SYSU T00068]